MVKSFLHTTWVLVATTIGEWRNDNAPRFAAALAFYMVFSTGPLAIIVMGIAGLVFGEQAVRGEIMHEIEHLAGPEGARAIQALIASSSKSGQSGLATLAGGATLLIASVSAFAELKGDLNAMWGVKPKPAGTLRSVLNFVRARFSSFIMVLALGAFLLFSLFISTVLSYVGSHVSTLGPGTRVLMDLLNVVVSLGNITVLLAVLFKYTPDAHVEWRDVWIGALVTALMFNAGKLLIGFYLSKSSVTSSFGAAGSFVAFLLWVYYSAQVLFLGAEFTKVQASLHGAGVQPSKSAVRVA